MNSNIIEDLNWRFATKKFDSTKKISQENLDILLEVLRLAPSSYGLQPLKYLLIENKDVREKLQLKSYGQKQITDASHLIVICSYADIHDEHIDSYVSNTAAIRKVEIDSLKRFGDMMKNSIGAMGIDKKLIWSSKQAYIALGHLLHAAAQLRIDATPMEGFDATGYDEVLNLSAQNLHAVVVCPIGYRAQDDHYQHLPKVRKAHADIIEII